jgi:nucleotide-binding universal stress UspA family protein
MIVVGVDGSEDSKEALRWALAESRLRDSRVRAVHAWHYSTLVGSNAYAVPEEVDGGASQSAASDLLEEAVTAVAGDTTDVDIERVVLQGAAAKILIDESEHAELLVVASRGRGGFASLLLGSVSQQCAHHARCPVVIVRPTRATA